MKTSHSKFCQCLYFSTAALARKVEKLAVESWKPVGLSPSHGYLLLAVLDEPGIQPTALGAQLQLQPSTITRFIEKLEQKKLLIRTTEGRVTNVYATPKAKELQNQMTQCLQHFAESYTQALGKEESTKLVNSLTKNADRLNS